MKRSTLLIIITLIILIAATVLVIQNQQKGTIPERHKNFAFKDTADITKIFIADMSGNSVTLIRNKNHQWLVNNKYPANKFRIKYLLETIFSIEVKDLVPKAARNNVIKDLATMGKKVEIYTKRKRPVKAYYVGGPTQDHLGTYMALDNRKKEPFIIHKPGFYGYLSDGYYFTFINEWRTKQVFAYKPTNIKSVEIRYKDSLDNSFILNCKSGNNFELLGINKKALENDSLDINRVKNFLVGFKSVYFEEIIEGLKQNKKDSIHNVYPYITIIITNNSERKKTLFLLEKPSDLRTRVEYKKGIDGERYIAYTDFRKQDIVYMQLLTLRRILWKFEDFKIKK